MRAVSQQKKWRRELPMGSRMTALSCTMGGGVHHIRARTELFFTTGISFMHRRRALDQHGTAHMRQTQHKDIKE